MSVASLLAGYLPTALGTTNTLARPEEIPPLRPPKPEIVPGFWEQHGLLVSVTGLILVLVIILLWRMLARAKPPVIPAPAEVARQALEPLREHTEDSETLTRVSAILRRYFITAFNLQHLEFTNSELCRELERHPKVGKELSKAANGLLEGMEHRRFDAEADSQSRTNVPAVSDSRDPKASNILKGGTPSSSGTGKSDLAQQAGRLCHGPTVERALELINLAEKELQPPPPPATGTTPHE